jgi:hypothetical protein
LIPVPIPSARLFLLLALGLLSGLILLGWGLGLAISPKVRGLSTEYIKTSLSLFLPLILLFSFFAWFQIRMLQLEREFRREQAARHVTLEQPTVVNGINMPAGTHLTLRHKNQLESYTEAEFSQAVPLHGLQVTKMERFVSDPGGDGSRMTASSKITLWGPGDQDVEGWHCDTTLGIEVEVENDGGVKSLEQCTLGRDDSIDALNIAPGSVLYVSNDEVYLDGYADPIRWRIEVKDAAAVEVFGLPLANPRINLNADRHLIMFSDASLARPTQFGDFNYPAGTQVKTLRPRKAGQETQIPYPGGLIFSPWNGQSAQHAQHADVPEGMSVVQTLDGELIEITRNEKVGVFHFEAIGAGDDR